MEKQEILTERTIVIEVLQKYRKLPYLWKQTHKLYSNKNARRQGYEIMLKSWKKLEPKATVECMKKKLNNWRAAYRRERKKIEDSMRTAIEPDEIHKPNLWYFDYLSFINDECSIPEKDDDDAVDIESDNDQDHDVDDKGREAIQDNNSDQNYDDEGEDIDEDSDEKPIKIPRKSVKRKSKDRSFKHESLIIEPSQVMIQSNVSSDENSADLFGRAIGSQLKELSKYQRCIAEKLISDIMFYAKLEQLTIGTSINLESSDT